jgi:hypothetical protein
VKAFRVQQILGDMIEAYEAGHADDDLQGFLGGWADTIAPEGEEKREKMWVLVHGSPFEHGLTVEGPYPEGVLDAQDMDDGGFRKFGGWWVVRVDEPSVKPEIADGT